MRHSGQSGPRAAGRGITHALEFLIANLELEFHLNPIRISNLKFSNRKFFAVFAAKFCTDDEPCVAFSSPEVPASSLQNPWPPWRLIETPRLEFLATHRQKRHFSFSNRDKTGTLPSSSLLAPRSSPSAPATQAKLGHPRITSYQSPDHASPASCIAPPPRLTWRLAILPLRSSGDAIQSQSFAIYPDDAGNHRFRGSASSCEPRSLRPSSGATARRR